MVPQRSTTRSFWLTLILFTSVISLWAGWAAYVRSGEAGILMQRSIWGGMLLLYAAVFLIGVWLFVQVARFGTLPFRLPNISFENPVWRLAGFIVFVALLFLIPYLKFNFQIGQTVKNPIYAFDPGMLLILYYWM